MKFHKLYIPLFVLTLLVGCTDDFEKINKNNNAPKVKTVGTLLPSVIFEPINSHVQMQTFVTDQVMQYVVRRNDNQQLGAYDFAIGQDFFAGIWRTNYTSIRNSKDMIAIAEGLKLNAYVAAGLIFNSYHAATASELWIDVPFTDAGKADENINPSYSKQQEIYTTILKDLDRANTLLDATAKFSFGGDVLFKGDATKWKKLANSLRLRYLLRLSNRPEINAAAEIKKMIADPVTYPIITSNADAGVYDFPGVAPNVSFVSAQAASTFTGVSPSTRTVALLQPSNDPRLDFFFVKPSSVNPIYPNHIGVASGTTAIVAVNTNGNAAANASSLTRRFTVDQGLLDYTIISYSEVQFILAEAAMKGWISGEAKTFYEKGITGNFDYWKIAVPAGFLAHPTVAWDNTMERLMDQKWMAFYLNNTIESWGETKRTGLPNFTIGPAAAATSGGKFPTRVFYPTLEQSINATSYKAGIANIGGDIITAKHWYQN